MSDHGVAPDDTAPQGFALQIESEIIALLGGGMRQTALDFVTYLRANQMAPQQWFGPAYWRIPYRTHYLCSILLSEDRWRVFFFSGDYGRAFDDELKAVVRDSVAPCISCTDDCPKATDITVFGKTFPGACFQFPIQFVNPDGNMLHCIKALIEYWKDAAPLSDSWHAH